MVNNKEMLILKSRQVGKSYFNSMTLIKQMM